MKKLLFLFMVVMPAIAMADSDVPFTLSGLQEGDHVMVTMSSESYLATLDINSDGDYAFSTVPVGKHYIKVEASGYALPDSKAVYVNSDGNIEPRSGIQLVITKIDEEDVWQHSWHEDGSIAGYTITSHVNQPAELVYLGKKIVPSDVPSKSILETNYGMVLSNNGETWTQEYAYRLLETMKTFPDRIQGDDITVIQLTKEPIADDVLIETVDGGKLVTLATDAY